MPSICLEQKQPDYHVCNRCLTRWRSWEFKSIASMLMQFPSERCRVNASLRRDLHFGSAAGAARRLSEWLRPRSERVVKWLTGCRGPGARAAVWRGAGSCSFCLEAEGEEETVALALPPGWREDHLERTCRAKGGGGEGGAL